MKELLERPEREQKQRPKRTQTLPVRRPQNTKSERQRAMEKLVHEKEEAGRRAQKKRFGRRLRSSLISRRRRSLTRTETAGLNAGTAAGWTKRQRFRLMVDAAV